MVSGKELFKSLLKDAGQSITTARMHVFDALDSQEPLSMHELVLRARGVDRASVYRAVQLFERLGIVQRLNTGWKYKIELTDKFAEHHHHLTCLQCGKTIAIGEAELEDVLAGIAACHRFKPSAHQIEIQGYCENCQPASLPAPGKI